MLAAAPDPSRGKVCWVLGAAHAAGVPSPVRIVLLLLIQRLFLKGLPVTPLPLQATYVTSQCSQPGIQAHTSAGQETAPCPGVPWMPQCWPPYMSTYISHAVYRHAVCWQRRHLPC